ncbi:MAG: Gfo/Idh/MocA family oxidoreductase [Planctomycetes bacterium]|nr:Gfo/Idh/MocA family oxidoreductase [Planctomycetota bacterium]
MASRKASGIGRRSFLAGAAATGGFLVVKPASVFGAPANSAIQIGIIGCGGRGHFIGQHFTKHTTAKIVALHDLFDDRLASAQKAFGVQKGRLYKGLEAYEELIASGVDAVAITSPPYCHPEQLAAAVAANKHAFMAKPVAVDVPGCKSIIASGEKARDKLSVFVDFQTRASPNFRQAARRVHEGAIGTPVCGQIFYQTGRLGSKAGPDVPDPERRIRNWVFDKALSGDIIVEQNVHVLDVSNWYLQSHPIKAYGTGGRKGRTDVGDCWDHFIVIYWYPNDVRIDFSSSQFLVGYHDMCMRVYGTEGTVDSHYNGPVKITGQHAWPGTDGDDTWSAPVINNVKEFIGSIEGGKYLNNARQASESTMTAVLGRIAAYENRLVTWDEIDAANVKIDTGLTA